MSLSVTVTHEFGRVNAVFGADAEALVSANFRKAMAQAGEILKAELVRGYSGAGRPGWPQLHWFTIQQKGHAEPLFHSGRMADHVVSVQDEYGVAVGFVDVEEARKALIQENGATIKVTPKMRAFLASRGFYLNKNTKFIMIPARRNFANALGVVLPQLTSLFTYAIEAHYRGKAI